MAKTYSEDFLSENKGTIFTTESEDGGVIVEVKKMSRKKDDYAIILYSSIAENMQECIKRGTLYECRKAYPAIRSHYGLKE